MILVVSFAEDEHTRLVASGLRERGHDLLQIDLSDFPAKRGMLLTWQDGQKPTLAIQNDNCLVNLAQARVAWWRRVRAYEIDSRISNPEMRVFATSETTQAVEGALDSLPCVWVNNRACDAAAHHKPYQWSMAQRIGLRMPRTLVTTQPDDARAFVAANTKTVFKPFIASIMEWRETRLVEDSDLEKLDLIRYAPVIFQEYIEGVDLRITVVGERVFAAEIDARRTAYPVDMRLVVGEATVAPVQLPRKVEDDLMTLMRRLGIDYGAIDMRRTADGEYYFLEVNPAGQWLFVEQRTEQPITDALVDLLAGHDRPARR